MMCAFLPLLNFLTAGCKSIAIYAIPPVRCSFSTCLLCVEVLCALRHLQVTKSYLFDGNSLNSSTDGS